MATVVPTTENVGQQANVPTDTSQILTSQLKSLIASATAKYAQKNYEEASELYSKATALQASINGEMSLENAELLYCYGRCLYHLAVLNSDVLGSKTVGEKIERAEEPENAHSGAIGVVKSVAGENSSKTAPGTLAPADSKAKEDKTVAEAAGNSSLFQFTGDENFDEPEDESHDDEEHETNEELMPQSDDFADAYEILDLARLLFEKKISHLIEKPEAETVDKRVGDTIKHIKENLADTMDLLAEISLEAEHFSDAVTDLKTVLLLKQELHPPYSSLVAETHFKLSLALEFSSLIPQDPQHGEYLESTDIKFDKSIREESAQQMEAAIESCRMRIEKEAARLKLIEESTEAQQDSAPAKQQEIDEVKEMVHDMEQRLAELRQPPVSVSQSPTKVFSGRDITANSIKDSFLGKSVELGQLNLDQLAKTANDLTTLVRRRSVKGPEHREGQASASKPSAKRPITSVEDEVTSELKKKVKPLDDK